MFIIVATSILIRVVPDIWLAGYPAFFGRYPVLTGYPVAVARYPVLFAGYPFHLPNQYPVS